MGLGRLCCHCLHSFFTIFLQMSSLKVLMKLTSKSRDYFSYELLLFHLSKVIIELKSSITLTLPKAPLPFRHVFRLPTAPLPTPPFVMFSGCPHMTLKRRFISLTCYLLCMPLRPSSRRSWLAMCILD